MKKIFLILFIFLFSYLFLWEVFADNCDFDPTKESSSISSSINNCLSDSKVLVQSWWDLKLASGFKTVILWWITKVSWILLLLAVWSLVYAWFMLISSVWEDDKINKAKNLIKWTLIWALWVVWSSSIIAIVVQIMYKV